MRQYAGQGSGTMMNSQRGQEPLDAAIDRIMMIAKRVVVAENQIKNQATTIQTLTAKIDGLIEENKALQTKVENIALKASGKEFKKPSIPARRTKAKVEEDKLVSNSILDEGIEV